MYRKSIFGQLLPLTGIVIVFGLFFLTSHLVFASQTHEYTNTPPDSSNWYPATAQDTVVVSAGGHQAYTGTGQYYVQYWTDPTKPGEGCGGVGGGSGTCDPTLAAFSGNGNLFPSQYSYQTSQWTMCLSGSSGIVCTNQGDSSHASYISAQGPVLPSTDYRNFDTVGIADTFYCYYDDPISNIAADCSYLGGINGHGLDGYGRLVSATVSAPTSANVGTPFTVSWNTDWNTDSNYPILSTTGPLSCSVGNPVGTSSSTSCTASGNGTATVQVCARGPAENGGPAVRCDEKTINIGGGGGGGSGPTVDLTLDYGNGPLTLPSGYNGTLRWTVSGASTCTASDLWSGSKNAAGGSEASGPITTSGTFTLICYDSNGNEGHDYVVVNLEGQPTVTPTPSGTATPTPPLGFNDAGTLAFTTAIPSTLTPGQVVSFTVHAQDTGNTRWYDGGAYQMRQRTTSPTISIISTGPTQPSDVSNKTYGHLSYPMWPGDTIDWVFNLTAPTTPGTYNFALQMVHVAGWIYRDANGNTSGAPATDTYFGTYLSKTFTVATANAAPTITLESPASGATVSGNLTLSGWAVDNTTQSESAVRWIETYLYPVGTSTLANYHDGNYGTIARADICATYPGRPGCNNVGFSTTFDTHAYANGQYNILIAGYDSDADGPVITGSLHGRLGTTSRVITINNPTPTATVTNVTQPNYCLSGPDAVVYWSYSEGTGSPQTAYQMQIDLSTGNFSSPVYDSGKISSSGTASAPGPGILQFNKTYKARVRVWNSYDVASAWSAASSNWSTPAYAYPNVNFGWAPISPVPGETTSFTDTTTFGSGTGLAWTWDFGDGSTSTQKNPSHAFATQNTFFIVHGATDAAGHTCTLQKTIIVKPSIPKIIEVAPQ